MAAWDVSWWKQKEDGGNGPRILVVDDDPEIVELVAHILERNSCEVVAQYSGEEAWATLLASQETSGKELDLVLLDVMMAGMDGYELCARIKKHDRLRFTPVLDFP